MREIFRQLNNAYNSNDFGAILNHQSGNYFLKLRSLSRAEILRQLAQRENIDIKNVQGRQLFEYLFCQNIPEQAINDYIREIYQQERNERIGNEDNLYSQLFRLTVFNWGGFYQNAVEQTIVNNYVKKIQDYNQLLNSVDNDLAPRLRNYVLCSWYNHWTSILIEDMFKDHEDILPAVGLVKKVDFFWNNFPFDLKVTYFPDGFMKLKRQQRGLRPELTEIKAFARQNNIAYDRNASDDDIFSELFLRITESTNQNAQDFILQFHQTRREIINETKANPNELIVWFYENQGTRRFDAANRLFIVLIDQNNLEESWKLKRNREILSQQINSFLNANRNVDFNQFHLNFNWEGNNYQSFATCLFIVRE
ncbi:MAG: hypothetical protein JSS98_02040 [Bacteroidetes bacterium]|nr:hypothetical protein [Bacteroidota bacterium]